MSKQQVLAGLDNIGIEGNPLDEFLAIDAEPTSKYAETEERPENKELENKMGRPRTRENYKHCSLDLPADIYEQLRAASYHRAIPQNNIIIAALRQFLKDK